MFVTIFIAMSRRLLTLYDETVLVIDMKLSG